MTEPPPENLEAVARRRGAPQPSSRRNWRRKSPFSAAASWSRRWMRRNLVDRYVLLIHPLVLGSGRRLFRDDLCRSEPRRSSDHHHRRGDHDLRPAQRVMAARRIVAWTSVTLDGYTSGPDGPRARRLAARACQPSGDRRVLRRHLARCWTRSSSGGRTTRAYAVRPAITRDESTDPRTRESAAGQTSPRRSWSRTLTDAPWRTRASERPGRRSRATAPGPPAGTCWSSTAPP